MLFLLRGAILRIRRRNAARLCSCLVAALMAAAPASAQSFKVPKEEKLVDPPQPPAKDPPPLPPRESLPSNLPRPAASDGVQPADPLPPAMERDDRIVGGTARRRARKARTDLPVPFGEPRAPAGRTLEPLVYVAPEAAVDAARRRDQPILMAVTPTVQGGLPELFRHPVLARASRMTTVLGVVDTTESDFLKARAVPVEKLPAILVLDSKGNVMDIQPTTARPEVLAAAARQAAALSRDIAAELANLEARSLDLPEDSFLKLVRPWLARRLQGYEVLDRFKERIWGLGADRLARALALDDEESVAALDLLAREFQGSPFEARAMVEMARIQNQRGFRDEARDLVRFVIDHLASPDNAESVARARAMHAAFRKEDVQRRLEEMNRQPRKP